MTDGQFIVAVVAVTLVAVMGAISIGAYVVDNQPLWRTAQQRRADAAEDEWYRATQQALDAIDEAVSAEPTLIHRRAGGRA